MALVFLPLKCTWTLEYGDKYRDILHIFIPYSTGSRLGSVWVMVPEILQVQQSHARHRGSKSQLQLLPFSIPLPTVLWLYFHRFFYTFLAFFLHIAEEGETGTSSVDSEDRKKEKRR